MKTLTTLTTVFVALGFAACGKPAAPEPDPMPTTPRADREGTVAAEPLDEEIESARPMEADDDEPSVPAAEQRTDDDDDDTDDEVADRPTAKPTAEWDADPDY